MHAEIDAEVGRTKVTGNSKEVDELESLVSRMSVGAKGGDVDEDISLALGGLGLSPGAKPHVGSMDAVERWLSVEENEEVAKGIVADMVKTSVMRTWCSWILSRMTTSMRLGRAKRVSPRGQRPRLRRRTRGWQNAFVSSRILPRRA